ncbi:MAG: glutathione S-transferase family protein [Alphaproteobacteria bacterium]|nr:glutathione S-transferase family protein [Alphaproteobacteria bacterium]
MALMIYGSTVSPFVRKVRVVMAEKGLQYTIDPVSPFRAPPDFREISPLGRIPAFRDTDLPEPNHLCDSSVICDYLEHKYPTPALYPSAPYDRARALWFEEYADSILAETMGRGFFFERVVKKILKAATDEAVCQTTLTEKLPPLFDYLSAQLGGNEYLVGGAFSIADITVATMLVNFEHAGGVIDAARWPKLAAYIKRMHERPSFKACIDEERPFIERVRAA